MRHLICLFVGLLTVSVFAGSTTVSTDTIYNRRQVWVEKSLGGASWTFISNVDSVIKTEDIIRSNMRWRRKGNPAFMDCTVVIPIRSLGIDTIDNGYTLEWTIQLKRK